MAKKKKSKAKCRDTRGYNTSSNSKNLAGTISADNAGKAARKVQVSTKAQTKLTELLDELKSSFVSQSNSPSSHERPLVSIEDRRFIKKVTILYDRLEKIGFTKHQIQSILVALITGEASESQNDNAHNGTVELFSLERALDWACLHLSSVELPKVLVEVNKERDVSDGKITIAKRLMTNSREDSFDGNSEVDSLFNMSNLSLKVPKSCLENEQGFTVSKNTQNEVHNSDLQEEDCATKNAKRAWLLQQYQYEEVDDDDDNHEEIPDRKNTSSREGIEERVEEKSKEEKRLEKVQLQIREDQESLKDDVANYMRSKFETNEIKKRLKKLENQARALQGKIEKQKVKTVVSQVSKEENESNAPTADYNIVSCKQSTNKVDKNNMVESDGLFDLFNENDEGVEKSTGSGDKENPTNFAESSPNSETEIESNSHIKSVIMPSIPNDWTGTTPKIVLLEFCRKQKLPKPIYQKMSQSGCKAIVTFTVKNQRLEIEEPGPFHSFNDAQQFASTKALYEINSTLPLYRLFPPVFRDLWKSWIDEKDAEKTALLEAENVKKEENILEMVRETLQLVKLKNELNNTPTASESIDHSRTEFKSKKEEIMDNWDEGSWDADDGNEVDLASSQRQPSLEGERLRFAFTMKQKSPGYLRMNSVRSTLPIYEYRQKLLDTIRENPVTVICAETGAGKTTQCPSFILEEALLSGFGDNVSIICTQPRRISAVSVSERVAEEMNESIGQHVGYHIRMEAKKSKTTKLLFCTTGVILRRLQDDPDLKGVTHVIVDEVHERQWQIDFLLIVLRRLLSTTRNDLKIVLMSATLDSQLFCQFFYGAPLLSIPGRTYPVSEYFLEDILEATQHVIEEGSRHAVKKKIENKEATLWVTRRGGEKRREVVSLESESQLLEVSDDYKGYSMSTRRSMVRVDETVINYDLIEDLLMLLLIYPERNSLLEPPNCDFDTNQSLFSKGSILIFLPGMGEIKTLNDRLRCNRLFGNKSFEIIPMHSTLSSKDQKRAFHKPRHGCQKIILATNIAETSVTIADCVFVIDTGLVREVRQDKRSSISTLVTDWTSKASSKQRCGRAGRVMPGICCKLYSTRTANFVMRAQSMPELQRIPLEEVCLNILGGNLATNCIDFLLQAPQPPSESSVQNALRILEEIGAINPISTCSLDRIETLTPLGKHLSRLPVHVRLGKILIFGSLFKVLDKVLTIAASLSVKSPFSSNINDSRQAAAAHRSLEHPTSDFLTVVNVWDAFRSASNISHTNAKKFCNQNFLNYSTLIEIGDMRRQFVDLLDQIGFVSKRKIQNSDVKVSQYNANAKKDEIVTAIVCAGLYPNVAHAVKNTSTTPVLFDKEKERVYFHNSSVNHAKELDGEWVAFHEKFATSKTFVSSTCLVKPFSLLLFGGSIVIQHLERKAVIDDWMILNVAAQTGIMFRELRHKLAILLNERVDGVVSEDYLKNDSLINGIVNLLSCE